MPMFEVVDNNIVKTREFPKELQFIQALELTRELYEARARIDHRKSHYKTFSLGEICAICYLVLVVSQATGCSECPVREECLEYAVSYHNHKTRENARRAVKSLDRLIEKGKLDANCNG